MRERLIEIAGATMPFLVGNVKLIVVVVERSNVTVDVCLCWWLAHNERRRRGCGERNEEEADNDGG